jgi:hypothetical protein
MGRWRVETDVSMRRVYEVEAESAEHAKLYAVNGLGDLVHEEDCDERIDSCKPIAETESSARVLHGSTKEGT